MADLIFVGQFVASKAGKTGLSPTVDVDRYTIADGSRTALVTAGSATEGRRGLYHYRLAGADLATYQYVATFITSDATVDQQEIAALGLVVPDDLTSSRLAPATTGRKLEVAATGEASADVTCWKGDVPSDLDASGNILAKLADVAHGGSSAELTLKKVVVSNDDSGGTAVLIASASSYAPGIGLDIRGVNGGKGIVVLGKISADLDGDVEGDIGGLSSGAQQDMADALKLAPASGTNASGSVYAELTALRTAQDAQLDWHAEETPTDALATLYDDNAVDGLTESATNLTAEGDTGFAAWVIQEFDSKLFVGVGKTPMNHIAAVVGSLTSVASDPVFEYALPEEGVSAMCVGPDNKLYVAGVDERTNTGDSSIYVRTAAGTWTRKQTIEDWQHVCGLAFDSGNRLWIAGQGASSVIAYSSDYGDTWTETVIGTGRAYDIIALSTAKLATWWDGDYTYSVYRFTALDGADYGAVSGVVGGIGRMVAWNSMIAGVGADGTIYTVDTSGTGTAYTPPFAPYQTYNNLAVDPDGYLCCLASDGSVWRTADLATWLKVWTPIMPATGVVKAIGLFGDDLVVSTSGADAVLLSRPAAPEDALQLLARDAMKLAPSTGDPTTGSVDKHLDDLLTYAAANEPADIWTYTTRTLTQSSTSTTDSTTAGSISRRRGDSWSISLTLGAITGYTSLWFTVKAATSDVDTASIFQIKKNASLTGDGLLYVNGAVASDATKGSITVSNATTGAIVVALDESITDDLAPASYSYDCQVLISGSVSTPDSGTFTVTADVTRAVA